ncbi:MAG: sigma 54-interacting transcriptional regulator [bacterium]|nr:sigma 54-interacting transcriptional regulator [bacterium]
MLARALHHWSPRRARRSCRSTARPFPRLLGERAVRHVKGAFTGAAAPDGGTLLLDEIGDMPLAAQAEAAAGGPAGRHVRAGRQRPQGEGGCAPRRPPTWDLEERVRAGPSARTCSA